MGIFARIMSGAMLLTLAAGPVRAGEDKDLRATIAKAVQAVGGEARQAKYQGMTMKGSGTFYGLGEGIPFVGEWHFQGHKQSRFVLEIKVMNQALTFTQIVNGDKGWVKFNEEVKAMPEGELAEEKEDMYAKWVCSLLPLKDKAFKLTALGEVKVDDKTAQGVRVSREGKRDINLYFDKTSGLLVKSEHQVKDVKGGGDKDMSQETIFADYKEFKGTKYPTKIHIKRDGNQFVDADMTEIRPVEMVDEAMFAQP
jgi:hypothetical protein